MKSDRETKEKPLKSAKSEFLEKGYMKASLRKICADAGVTTGALYFFFEGKEDLFAAIVEPPLKTLTEVLIHHLKQLIILRLYRNNAYCRLPRSDNPIFAYILRCPAVSLTAWQCL